MNQSTSRSGKVGAKKEKMLVTDLTSEFYNLIKSQVSKILDLPYV